MNDDAEACSPRLGYLFRSALVLWGLLTLAGCASQAPVSSPGDGVAGGVVLEDTVFQGGELQDRLQQVFDRYQGTPYRYGGTTSAGFDCSGFIGTAYREALGIRLPRTTDQLRGVGQAVSLHQLQPGDLVFFDLEVKDQHAGIYMGRGRFIHASTSVGVTESRLDGGYWAPRFSRARRLP